MKRKSTSILGVVIAILLILVVCITLLTNILFSRHDTPKVFGHYIYMMKSDSMEVNQDLSETEANTEGGVPTIPSDSASIHAETAVIATAYEGEILSANNAILCVLSPDDTSSDKDSEGIAVRRILSIEQDQETGVTKYYPTTMQPDRAGTEPPVTETSIVGICKFESKQLYHFVDFITSFKGILLTLALPAVLLIVMIIVSIVRASSRNRGEEYGFEESYDELVGEDSYDNDIYEEETYEDYDDENNEYTQTYEPSPAPTPIVSQKPDVNSTNIYNTSSFEMKKSTIAQNFEKKAVNPNSPYQKARTMQFKAQKEVPILGTPYNNISGQVQNATESSNFENSQQQNNYVGKYSTDNVNNINSLNNVNNINTEAPADINSYRGAHEAAPGTTRNLRSSRLSSSSSSYKRPDVQDILASDDPIATISRETSQKKKPVSYSERRATQTTSSKRTSSTSSYKSKYDKASVDDLLNMIENEKKKLK